MNVTPQLRHTTLMTVNKLTSFWFLIATPRDSQVRSIRQELGFAAGSKAGAAPQHAAGRAARKSYSPHINGGSLGGCNYGLLPRHGGAGSHQKLPSGSNGPALRRTARFLRTSRIGVVHMSLQAAYTIGSSRMRCAVEHCLGVVCCFRLSSETFCSIGLVGTQLQLASA